MRQLTATENEGRLELMCESVLHALEQSACGAMTLDALAQDLWCSRIAAKAAVQKLLDDGACVVTLTIPQFILRVQQ